MSLATKNGVVTGGSTGIGLATARAFINAGATVLITGRRNSNLQKAANLEGIATLEKAVAEDVNKLDVPFSNAAIATLGPIAQTTEADFDAQFNTNVKEHYFTLQKLMPCLADGSSIIVTSSVVATAAGIGTSIYSATKGALNKIAQIAANELADRKIRVTIVSPGPIQTPGLDSVAPAEAKSHLAASTALQRIGGADEVANMVLFLASDAASFISGADIAVDGGSLQYRLK